MKLASYDKTESATISVLSDGSPESSREIVDSCSLGYKAAESTLRRLRESEVALCTQEAVKERNRIFKGRESFTRAAKTFLNVSSFLSQRFNWPFLAVRSLCILSEILIV